MAANPPEHLICQGGLGKTEGSGHTSHKTSRDLSSRQAHPPRLVPAHVKTADVSLDIAAGHPVGKRSGWERWEGRDSETCLNNKVGKQGCTAAFQGGKRPHTACLLLPSRSPATLTLLHMGNNWWTALNRKAPVLLFPPTSATDNEECYRGFRCIGT